jgi:hypothetical protein
MAAVGASSIGKASAACKIHDKTLNGHGQKKVTGKRKSRAKEYE